MHKPLNLGKPLNPNGGEAWAPARINVQDWTSADDITSIGGAVIRRLFAVHPGLDNHGWALTHLPTGLMVAYEFGDERSRLELMTFAESLDDLQQLDATDFSGGSALASATLLHERVRKFYRRRGVHG